MDKLNLAHLKEVDISASSHDEAHISKNIIVYLNIINLPLYRNKKVHKFNYISFTKISALIK
ncbi:hypothetical protein GCM10010984_25840 [Chishuiella changwenlii]|uniref:Uncharacterized protein n=1 Tax=Chishuiella changwenlii TaxID=1434701 RepID=A0ABQ1U119_9FLAO|nr:hypothetical protein GCM10010984_25840 [Chishuiella changwenlii]